MFCSTYNKSLTHAAAGGELSPAQREHLAACEPCRVAFAAEQSLFAAIDSGLRASANSQVPTTLIPRIHVGIADPPQTRRFAFSFAATASAAVIALMIVGTVYLQFRAPSIRTAANPVVTPDSAAKIKPDFPSIVNLPASGSVSPSQHRTRAALTLSHGSNPAPPEVIVSPEEGTALLRYEALLRKTRASEFQTAAVKPQDVQFQIEPLEIAKLELAELKIPSLTKQDSEGGTK